MGEKFYYAGFYKKIKKVINVIFINALILMLINLSQGVSCMNYQMI